ncbi:MAG TPA: transposase [Chthoniobacteraceae bacterium]|jgi:hypothetical protein|nr:transposase [Chthoniobacteraceae bacterium]
MTWRHLDVFEHRCEIRGRLPRGRCTKTGKIYRVRPPWEGLSKHFTKAFEAMALLFLRDMPVAAVARKLHEHDTRLWRMLKAHVAVAHPQGDWSNVCCVGCDEMSVRKGHRYVSVFCDLIAKRVLFATPGKDKRTWELFARALEDHFGHPRAITEVSMDMSLLRPDRRAAADALHWKAPRQTRDGNDPLLPGRDGDLGGTRAPSASKKNEDKAPGLVFASPQRRRVASPIALANGPSAPVPQSRDVRQGTLHHFIRLQQFACRTLLAGGLRYGEERPAVFRDRATSSSRAKKPPIISKKPLSPRSSPQNYCAGRVPGGLVRASPCVTSICHLATRMIKVGAVTKHQTNPNYRTL